MRNINIDCNEEKMSCITAFSKKKYMKKELLPELLELQRQLVNLVFDGTNCDLSKLRLWDVERRLEIMNESCNHREDELLLKVEADCKVICNMIKSEFAGNIGEHKANLSIDTISNKKAVLKNVELSLGEHRTELDSIVFTDNAIFIIEVKNPRKNILIDERGNYCRVDTNIHYDKNIGERMNEKKYLLKSILEASGIVDPVIESILVFTNNSIKVESKYPYIKFCYLSGLPYMIEQYHGTKCYSDTEINKMIDGINNAQHNESYSLPIDMNMFKYNFVLLLEMLENDRIKYADNESKESIPINVKELSNDKKEKNNKKGFGKSDMIKYNSVFTTVINLASITVSELVGEIISKRISNKVI